MMIINQEMFGLIAEGTTRTDAEKRLAVIERKLANPPKTLIPAAIPVLEKERDELKRFLEICK